MAAVKNTSTVGSLTAVPSGSASAINNLEPSKQEKPDVDEFGLPIKKAQKLDIQDQNDNGSSVTRGKDGSDSSTRSRKSGDNKFTKTHSADSSVLSTTSNGNHAAQDIDENPPIPQEKPKMSEWSHMAIYTQKDELSNDKFKEDEGEWQDMPAYASTDLYDDNGRLIAKEARESDDEGDAANGGATKGYTRLGDDDDARSVTSMDESTSYLFKEDGDDEASKNPLSQMQLTKELLTEGQRVAYVGVCRLAMIEMIKEQEKLQGSRSVKKTLGMAVEATRMWSQKMINRLYAHMDITPEEQVMIEQLAEHGVLPSDITPTLMKNARVLNPLNEHAGPTRPTSVTSHRGSVSSVDKRSSTISPPPPYEKPIDSEVKGVRNPTELIPSKTLDIDIRWTLLCDLFLVLIADSVYDARSRVLLEKVGSFLEVPWLEICKFEKKVTDALEMQEATQQNWSEEEHMENRRKQARNRRYMMMGLATIGGGLVIGLSGGLLAPVIGAGLAAGFTTIGVAGTGGFLAGAGGTAIITSTAVVSGSTIGARASLNRTRHVKTFEYRPLYNSKRVNLIITLSGWMTTSKDDDVRLPFSTVDPIMGDLFSVLWEPEMLRSMGQTINLLATEVLTQSLQQVLGSTILVALMSSIQLPVILTKLSYLLDNPWSVSLDRAWAAGLILADSLTCRNLGVRPVTLVGYSLGARVIYACLQELSRVRAYGLVQNVYLFGSPVVAKKDEYMKARSVVSGRFVNGYARNDWVLGYLFRATSGGIGRVAGLAPINNVPGIENVDVTDLVEGHMAYRQAIPKLLRRVGWIVLDDEFTEIEDPDPDKHRVKQRELISELDQARKKLEEEEKGPQKKKLFGFFGRGKDRGKKKEWETYDEGGAEADKKVVAGDGSEGTTETATVGESGGVNSPSSNSNYDDGVLFDIDAIRKELTAHEESERNRKNKDSEKVDTYFNSEDRHNYCSSLLNTPTSPSPPQNLRHSKSFNDASHSLPFTRSKGNNNSNGKTKSSKSYGNLGPGLLLPTIQSPRAASFGSLSLKENEEKNENCQYHHQKAAYYSEYHGKCHHDYDYDNDNDEFDEFGNLRRRNSQGDGDDIQMTFDTWNDHDGHRSYHKGENENDIQLQPLPPPTSQQVDPQGAEFFEKSGSTGSATTFASSFPKRSSSIFGRYHYGNGNGNDNDNAGSFAASGTGTGTGFITTTASIIDSEMMDKNVWDDEDEFKEEGEVTMSFA